MLRTVASAALLAATALPVLAQPGGNAAILESARRVALSYARNLPNFVCNEEVRRLGNWYSAGTWVQIDTMRLNVSFHDQKETYELVARNGRPSRQKLGSLSGAFSQGEFGSVLRLIFEPKSKAVFTWREWELSGVRPLAVFDYRVPLATSEYVLQALSHAIVVGFRGHVAIDPETGRTMRWTIDAEIPSNFPIAESVTTLEYGLRQIGGTEYLLPVRAEVVAAERVPRRREVEHLPEEKREAALRRMRYRNLIEFRDYRKFTADARITF